MQIINVHLLFSQTYLMLDWTFVTPHIVTEENLLEVYRMTSSTMWDWALVLNTVSSTVLKILRTSQSRKPWPHASRFWHWMCYLRVIKDSSSNLFISFLIFKKTPQFADLLVFFSKKWNIVLWTIIYIWLIHQTSRLCHKILASSVRCCKKAMWLATKFLSFSYFGTRSWTNLVCWKVVSICNCPDSLFSTELVDDFWTLVYLTRWQNLLKMN